MNSNENADRTASSSFRRMSALVSQVEAKWEGIQVGRQGSYSIERLESLEHYCNTTTTTHVVWVCLLTPLPALSAALLLETLPLRPASDGWAANWVFWIRLAFISFMLLTSGLLVMKRLVNGLSLTWGKILVTATGVGASSAGFAILLAIVVGFPVPFVAVLGSLPNGLLIGAMLALMFGIAPFRRSSPLRPALAKFYTFLVAHQTLVAIYPLVKVLYGLVPAKYQGFTMLLLPLWKFAAKKYVGHSVHDLEDYVPGIVAFNVDYFSTLFVSVSMFNSGSFTVSMLAILTDALFSLLEYRELRKNADTLYKLLQDHRSWSYSHLSHQEAETLVSLTLQVARNPEMHNIKSLPGVRLWACGPHPLASDRLDALKRLEILDVYGAMPHGATKVKLSPKNNPVRKPHLRSVSVAPVTVGPVENALENSSLAQASCCSINTITTDGAVVGTARSEELVVQGLQLLFHCEYVVLVEYVECVVPLVFVIYKTALQQLPNVAFVSGGVDGWQSSSIGNIMIFAVLEIFSFIALKVLLQRKFAFYPLYQLAYVLETQVELVQIDVFIATLVLLPCELEHFGMDFSLRFDWLRS